MLASSGVKLAKAHRPTITISCSDISQLQSVTATLPRLSWDEETPSAKRKTRFAAGLSGPVISTVSTPSASNEQAA